MKGLRIVKRVLILVIGACAILSVQANAAVDTSPTSSYWYNASAEAVSLPDVYKLENNIDLASLANTKLNGIRDAYISKDNKIYVLDSGGTILILDAQYKLLEHIQTFTYKGNEETLNEPEGIFVDNEGFIFIADTANFRVIKTKGGEVQKIFNRPENLTGMSKDLDYLPSKIVTDTSGRMFVVIRNIGMGIVVLDKNGNFISYRGAPSVKLSLYDLFWRRFSTEEQLQRMKTYIPTEYNNISIDKDNFLVGTISSISEEDMISTINTNNFGSDVAPIKKLNLSGEDILIRKGLNPPVGDLTVESLSSFSDVALFHSEIYTVLDSSKGRLFTYNGNGELLFVFGGIGTHKDNFSKPVAVSYLNDQLLVFDEKLNQIFCFGPTAYGNSVINAVKYYYLGEYDKSNLSWEEVLNYNANHTLAYVGVGKAYYQKGEYHEAMESFKIANDMKNYSASYKHLRDNFIKSNFKYFVVVLLAGTGIGILFSIIKRVRKYLNG